MEASLPRFRRLAVSTQSFRRLALASAVMLVVIVGSGATVRLTGSGLGCEHWPGCQAGDPFPKTGYHSYVEFSNRIVSAFAILAALATWLASLRAPGVKRWVHWVAGGAFLGTLLQAPLGAITVYYKLNPWLVGTHLLLSMVVLALGVLVALEAWDIRGDPVPARAARAGRARRGLLLRAPAQRRPLDRRRAALGQRQGSAGLAASSRPSTSTCARPRFSGLRSSSCSPGSAIRQPATCARRSSCSASSSCR